MAMTPGELRSQLSEIEPSERMYAGIGPDEVPVLRQLLEDDEAWLAARAVYALSRVDALEAHAAVADAARSTRPEVRLAAAINAPRLPPERSDAVLESLLADEDVGVRKFAIRAVSDRNDPDVKRKLEAIAESDVDRMLRGLARERLTELDRG